jgi:hypothetical protein
MIRTVNLDDLLADFLCAFSESLESGRVSSEELNQ